MRGDRVDRLTCSSVRFGRTFTLVPNVAPLWQPGKVTATSSYCHEPYGCRMLLRAATFGTVTENWNDPFVPAMPPGIGFVWVRAMVASV